MVDSIQLQKNIEELMNRASMQNIEEDMLPDQNLNAKADSTVSITAAQNNSVSTKTNPNPLRTHQDKSNPVENKQVKKPKAVMRRDR